MHDHFMSMAIAAHGYDAITFQTIANSPWHWTAAELLDAASKIIFGFQTQDNIRKLCKMSALGCEHFAFGEGGQCTLGDL